MAENYPPTSNDQNQAQQILIGVALNDAELGKTLRLTLQGHAVYHGEEPAIPHTASVLIREAQSMGITPPDHFVLSAGQVFYGEQNVEEVRLSGYVPTEPDAQGQVSLFPWHSKNPPRLTGNAQDGLTLDPNDEGRAHLSAMTVEGNDGLAFLVAWDLRGKIPSLNSSHAIAPYGLPFTPEKATILSDPYSQSFARSAWEANSDDFSHWERPPASWPFYKDPESGVLVFAKDGEYADPETLERAWGKLIDLDDAKVLAFCVALAKWVSDTGGDPTQPARVHVTDLLSFLGRQKHHAGGYRKEQKEAIKQDLMALNQVWVMGEQPVIERGKPILVKVEDRLLHIATEHEGDLLEGLTPYAFRIRPGEWARPYVGEMRFTAQLFRPIFEQLHPAKDFWAIRLGIYLTWQWRMRASQASWEQPWKVETLMEGARLPQEDRNRDRLREQFERSLDTLHRIGAIAKWEYIWPEGEDLEAQLPSRNWFLHWKQWTVSITPPDWVKEHYAQIAPQRRKAITRQKQAQSAAKKKAGK